MNKTKNNKNVKDLFSKEYRDLDIFEIARKELIYQSLEGLKELLEEEIKFIKENGLEFAYKVAYLIKLKAREDREKILLYSNLINEYYVFSYLLHISDKYNLIHDFNKDKSVINYNKKIRVQARTIGKMSAVRQIKYMLNNNNLILKISEVVETIDVTYNISRILVTDLENNLLLEIDIEESELLNMLSTLRSKADDLLFN